MCRATRQKGIDVSGIIGVACACHAIFCPGGMVDLYVGKWYIILSNSRLLAEYFHRYSHVDYAVSRALWTVNSSVEVYITYHIACQYGTHFVKHLSDFSDLDPELLKKIKFFVLTMHLLAHKEWCQFVYALYYSNGSGMTHGKTIEHPWSKGNQAGGSTQEMNLGH